MTEKLKDYQVLDVLCGGTFYKVKHKVTNNIFAWKAYDCTAYSDEQIENIVNEVKTISKVTSGNLAILVRFYDTILHNASKTLYFVLEYNSWQSIQELIDVCKATEKYFSENFIWHLLLELARACKVVENFNFAVIKKCITPTSIYVDCCGDVRVDCFQLPSAITGSSDLIQQIGDVIQTMCYMKRTSDAIIEDFDYSEDLRDVLSFLTDERNTGLRPEVVIYYPTILTNIEAKIKPKHLTEILISDKKTLQKSDSNKCDSEKAVEMCKTIKPLPRTQFHIVDSPIYSNINPKTELDSDTNDIKLEHGSLSPTLAALALELPGYVPRCRRPYSEASTNYNAAQRVSEETLSHQWMSRLIALREREQSLNRRERELVVKEIINSPAAKYAPKSSDVYESNGITLPPIVASAEKNKWKSRRRRRRSSSVRSRARRQSYSYEDLDSSLSADTGDGSIIVTATKFTTENMPRRNIFPALASKKVHFTPTNPFVGSDESVTLTFYDLDHLNNEENNDVMHEEKDIRKFKYLDLENNASDDRFMKQWCHSSPSKQAKVFKDITNHGTLRKTPSKSSLTSRSSITSRCSMVSARSHWSMESSNSKFSEGYVSDRTRSSMRQYPQTPTAPPELKKTKSRKSLLHFKTPFKFKSSSKV